MTLNLAQRIIFLILLALLVTTGGVILALFAPEPLWRVAGLASLIVMALLALAWANHLARPIIQLLEVVEAHLRGDRDYELPPPEEANDCALAQKVHSLLIQARTTEEKLESLGRELSLEANQYSQALARETGQRQHLEATLEELRLALTRNQEELTQHKEELTHADSRQRELEELREKLRLALTEHREALAHSEEERQRLEQLTAQRAEALSRQEEELERQRHLLEETRNRSETHQEVLNQRELELATLVTRHQEEESRLTRKMAEQLARIQELEQQLATPPEHQARIGELESQLEAARSAGQRDSQRLATAESGWERSRQAEQEARRELEALRRELATTRLAQQAERARATTQWEERLSSANTQWEERLSSANTQWEERLSSANTQWEERLSSANTQWEERLSDLRTRLEEEASTLNELLNQLARHMHEGVYTLDSAGRLTFCNTEAERLLGWHAEELRGKLVHDIIHYQNPQGQPIPASECPVHKAMQSGQVMEVANDVFTRRDGQLIPVTFVAAPLRSPGNTITGSVTVFQDLSQRKQVEREIRQARDVALEASRIKSEFLANMSHEIRTPMNGIIGMTDLLLDTKLNREQRELAGTVKDSANALLTIINDILDFAKIEAGTLELEPTDFDPVRVVEGVSELLAPQAVQKGLDLLTDLSSKLPRQLRGDASRLRQILLNLVGNALKFTKKGEVVISVQVDSSDDTTVHLRFAVKDTGIGIAKEEKSRLFQPFSQADGSSSRSFGGTGLGLSIAKRLVVLMGGQIGYQSRKGKGSIFWFTVPLALPTLQREPLLPVPPSLLRGTKVLVVVRNPTSQTILLNLLLSWNMRPMGVETLAEALAAIHEQADTIRDPFDLVVVDVGTDPESRFAFARQLAGASPTPALPLILLTACTHPEHLQQIHDAGFGAYVIKPIQRDRLQQALLTALQSVRPALEPSPTTLPGRPTPLATPPPAPERLLLLAEDNVVNQKVTQLQLKRLGYAVHVAANGREALDAMAAADYLLVLMDCQMPVMDGFEATRRIREIETASQRRRTPIIALTANTSRGDRDRCLDAGMDDYLSKPVEIEELEAKLAQWLTPVAPLSPRVRFTPPPPRSTPETTPLPISPGFGPSLLLPEPAPIDLARLQDFFNGDEQMVREFLERYLSRTGSLLAQARQAIRHKDAPRLVQTAREHANVSANMGATAMAEICRELAAQAIAGHWGSCRQLLNDQVGQFGAVENQINQM